MEGPRGHSARLPGWGTARGPAGGLGRGREAGQHPRSTTPWVQCRPHQGSSRRAAGARVPAVTHPCRSSGRAEPGARGWRRVWAAAPVWGWHGAAGNRAPTLLTVLARVQPLLAQPQQHLPGCVCARLGALDQGDTPRGQPRPLFRDTQQVTLNLGLEDEQGSVSWTSEAVGRAEIGWAGELSGRAWEGSGVSGGRCPCPWGQASGEPTAAQVVSDQHLGRRPSWAAGKGQTWWGAGGRTAGRRDRLPELPGGGTQEPGRVSLGSLTPRGPWDLGEIGQWGRRQTGCPGPPRD